jgi:ATP-binding cassette subfamily A (ABC1) protein 3
MAKIVIFVQLSVLFPDYYREGFLFVQYAVDESIISTVSLGEELEEQFDVFLRRFPYPPYIDDDFLLALQGYLPLIFVLSFIYPVINISKSIVYEKEKRLKVQF